MTDQTKEEFTKATVRRKVNKILNRIALEEDIYVYQLIENMAKEKYPDYFRERKKVTA
jgi:hypothetical protein